MRSTEPARYVRFRFRRSEQSSGEPRRGLQMPGEASFISGRGIWALTVLFAVPGCWSGEIWGRAEGSSPLSSRARSLWVRPWVGCSVRVLGAQMSISLGMHTRGLVCAYIRIHSSASLSRFSAAARWTPRLRPFRLLSKSFNRGFRSSRGESSASFPPF